MENNKDIEIMLTQNLQKLGPSSADILLEEIEDKAAAPVISAMLSEGRLLLTRKKKLALPEQTGLVFGRIQGNIRGFAFFIPADGSGDMFVPAENVHGAMHGDMVWVRRTDNQSRNGSPEAEVAIIALRSQSQIVGTYEANSNGGGFVVPDDAKLAVDVMIMPGECKDAKNGDKVVTNIVQYPDGRRPLTGKITEILGGKNEKGTDILSVIRRMELPDAFSKPAQQQARRLNKPVENDETARREDLRAWQIITIDGADAKDLDDAVSLVKLSCGNYILGVHIADVGFYIAEGTPLDKEAYKRGTSVYFPDRVLPMFPKQISNGVCSLNEGEVKCTLSCIMEFTPEGKPVSHRFSETVIQTAHRMSYEDVNAMFGGDTALQEKYSDIWQMLQEMRALAEVFHERRVKRGSIDFDLNEAEIVLDKQGKPVDVRLCERGEANRMIEEFMLAANETVARHMRDLNVPMLYRVHEKPDKEKLHALNTFLGTLGYGIKSIGNVRPVTLQRILERAKGTKEENVISRVTLRSLKRARYCESCLGHFGLALECYCHFTSPIRRYPDLVVHRLLKELMHGGIDEKRAEGWKAALPEIASHTSDREQAAAEAERAADDLKKAEYMQSHVGAVETGVIAGVTQYGFFVQLPNTVEGLVRIASIEGDYYIFDEKNYRIVGRGSKKSYRLGDEVRVRVAGVDLENANIDFVLHEGTHKANRSEKPAISREKADQRKPSYKRKNLAKRKERDYTEGK